MAAAALIALAFAGTAMNAVGSIRQGAAEQAQAEFAAKQAENNAGKAERNATLAREAAFTDERRNREQSAQTLGGVRAAFGANGLGSDGTAADYMAYQGVVAEENAMDIRHEGVLKAMGYKEDAQTYRLQADQYRKTGSAAVDAGVFGAAGAIVSGAGKIADNLYSGGRSSTRSTTGGAASVPRLARTN